MTLIRGYSPSEFGKNIQEIVDRINGSIEAEIILITSIYLGFLPEGETVDKYYNVIEKIADKNKIPVAKVHKYWENHIKDISRFQNPGSGRSWFIQMKTVIN